MLQSIDVTEDGGPPIHQSIGHDRSGNMTRVGQSRMTYGARNTLQGITSSGAPMGLEDELAGRPGVGGQRTLEYDADGRMVAEGFKRRFLLADGRPFFESARGGGVSRVYLGDRLLATIELTGSSPRRVRHVFADHIGFPLATVAGDDEVWQSEALPFGEVLNSDDEGDPTLRYPGQWQLWDEGEQPLPLFLNGYRWYHPGWGRYTQSDPIGIEGGLNLYEYARGNPALYTDSTGLQLAVPPRDPFRGDPFDPLPDDCTGGPWQFVKYTYEDAGSRRVWSLYRAVPLLLPRVGTPGPRGTGGGSLGCACYYILKGVDQMTNKYSQWRQEVSCFPCYRYTRDAFRFEGEIPRPIGYMSRGRRMRTIWAPSIAGAGCYCPQSLP